MELMAIKETRLQTAASEPVVEVRQNKGEGTGGDRKKDASCCYTYFSKAWQCAREQWLI